jgi:hypothetical protein
VHDCVLEHCQDVGGLVASIPLPDPDMRSRWNVMSLGRAPIVVALVVGRGRRFRGEAVVLLKDDVAVE